MSYKKYSKKGSSLLEVKNPSPKQLLRKKFDHQRVINNRAYVNIEIHKRGCCEFCQKTFHPRVYQWHHIWDEDPTNKKISKMLSRSTPQKFNKEFEKVVLLCPTCHVTFHADLVCMLDHRKQRSDGTYYDSYHNWNLDEKSEDLKPKLNVLDFFDEEN